MKTPIIDFVRAYAERDAVRFHMPGHKGKSYTGAEKYDITEISGADVLSSASGIIMESEKNAAELFSTLYSFYSCEGSTLAIKAMLKLATDKDRKDGRAPRILAGRNAHKSFISACALIGIDVKWIYPAPLDHISVCNITPECVAKRLSEMVEAPSAVYVTSPDYLGNLVDICGIAKVCKEHGVPLLVDNAHGAYLNFLDTPLHPIALGAAMCADSAHKTLPCLTGGAYLHVSRDYPEYIGGARAALSTFASTSPSYLILQSLDKCNEILSTDFRARLDKCILDIKSAKEKIAALGITVMPSEPLKITLCPLSFGYTGTDLARYLSKNGIEAEFSDTQYTVLMVTPDNSTSDLEYLCSTLVGLSRRDPIECKEHHSLPSAKQVMSIRDAVFSPHEIIDVHSAIGRICATPMVSCPPAIPIALCGEEICEEAIRLFLEYGIREIEVVIK